MDDIPNVLSRLVKNEDSTTEMLCGLMSFSPVRDAVLRLFTENKITCSEVHSDDIDTQFDTKTHGRPDLYISNDKCTILVEVKTGKGTSLTHNQPANYIEWLERNMGNTAAYFVALVPEGYIHNDVFEQCKVRKSEKVSFNLVTWEKLINCVESAELHLLNVYVADFLRILKKWYIPVRIEISYEEVTKMFDKNTASGLTKLMKTVDEVIDKLQVNIEGIEIEPSRSKRLWENGEYGCYVKYKQENVLWFGVWHTYWQDTGKPLGYGISDTWNQLIVKKFRNLYPNSKKFPYNKTKSFYMCDIEKSMFQDDNSVNRIVEILSPIIEQLKDALNN